jgi:NAD(P)H-nitrite reductase large subunit
MRTGDRHILAAGDVAEFEGQVPGLWPVAVAQAEVAADNAAGGTKLYEPVVPVTILKVVGIELTSIGRFDPGPDDDVIALEDTTGTRYRKLVIADGRIAGAILLGYSKEVAPVRTAITRGFDVSAHLPALRAGRWGVLTGLSGEQPLVPAVAA